MLIGCGLPFESCSNCRTWAGTTESWAFCNVSYSEIFLNLFETCRHLIRLKLSKPAKMTSITSSGNNDIESILKSNSLSTICFHNVLYLWSNPITNVNRKIIETPIDPSIWLAKPSIFKIRYPTDYEAHKFVESERRTKSTFIVIFPTMTFWPRPRFCLQGYCLIEKSQHSFKKTHSNDTLPQK